MNSKQSPASLSCGAEEQEGAQAVAALVLRLSERRQIRWSCPDKDGAIHQMVDGDDLLGAVYALSAYVHRLHPSPEAPANRQEAGEVERPDDDALEPHLPEHISGERRCGIQRSDWIPGWYVPWSPRNDNQNAEGPWSHWVALAEGILAADAQARSALTSPKDVKGGGR